MEVLSARLDQYACIKLSQCTPQICIIYALTPFTPTARELSLVVEYLPSMHKAGFNPQHCRKTKKQNSLIAHVKNIFTILISGTIFIIPPR
jgi:hypothetical protein